MGVEDVSRDDNKKDLSDANPKPAAFRHARQITKGEFVDCDKFKERRPAWRTDRFSSCSNCNLSITENSRAKRGARVLTRNMQGAKAGGVKSQTTDNSN